MEFSGRKCQRCKSARAIWAAAGATLWIGSFAHAGSTFNAGNARITHDADAGSGTAGVVKVNNPMSTSGTMSVPPTYSYGLATVTIGSGTSTAAATVGGISNSTTAGYTLASGTGVTQSDPFNTIVSYSNLTLQVDGTWTATSPSFGPTATGYTTFTLSGTVGAGGFAKAILNLRWTNTAKTVDYRTALSQTITFSTAGAFGTTVVNSSVLNSGSLTNGTVLRISGTIELQASNAGGPSSITPSDVEFTAAPPTSLFHAPGGTSSAMWTDPTIWLSDIPGQTIPNGIGVRAKFGENTVPQVLTLEGNNVLGTLDFDDSHGVTIQPSGASRLEFDVQSGNAVLFARNVNGNGAHLITAPVMINDDLEVINDSSGALSFGSIVTGTGGIIKDGLGTAVLAGAAPNSYTGTTTVLSGYLDANKPGAISGPSSQVNGGQLNYNANGAVANSVQTQVNANGVVHLGVIPGATDFFGVNTLGAISGGSTALAGLTVGSNLTLTAGAMIGHESLDTGVVGNPVGLFAVPVPSYIYGISGNFASGAPSIFFGSTSGTPWRGFGGDRGVRVYGSAGSNSIATQAFVSGVGELTSLGGELVINAPLNGAPGSSLTKTGAGVVSINNSSNSFSGPVNVQQGMLAVNGLLNGNSIMVQPHAGVGGQGTINGLVTLLDGVGPDDGAHLSPGHIAPSFFAPPPFAAVPTVGNLTLNSVVLAAKSQLDYELNTPGVVGGGVNDLLVVTSALTLDGFLNIMDGPNFGPGTYTLINYANTILDNGLQIGIAPPDYLYNVQIVGNTVGPGGSVILGVQAIPEPTSAAALLLAGVTVLRRRRRS